MDTNFEWLPSNKDERKAWIREKFGDEVDGTERGGNDDGGRKVSSKQAKRIGIAQKKRLADEMGRKTMRALKSMRLTDRELGILSRSLSKENPRRHVKWRCASTSQKEDEESVSDVEPPTASESCPIMVDSAAPMVKSATTAAEREARVALLAEEIKQRQKDRQESEMNAIRNRVEVPESLRLREGEDFKVITCERPSDEVSRMREKLPAARLEQEIIDIVRLSSVTIIEGGTGCGKSTQVPQFLLENGFCTEELSIGVTQPRRVAARSVAQRIACELGPALGRCVGYQVRFDKSNCGSHTKLKIMTEGILLREIQSDSLLSKYSVIVLDEVHQRSVNMDMLIGLLSRIVMVRRLQWEQNGKKPLRLILMSATMNRNDFTENSKLFPSPPPILTIEQRTFPVTVHFDRTTDEDYVQAAYNKIVKIHEKLPSGSILVFVPGRRDIYNLITKLEDYVEAKYARKQSKTAVKFKTGDSEASSEDEDSENEIWSSKATSGEISVEEVGEEKQIGLITPEMFNLSNDGPADTISLKENGERSEYEELATGLSLKDETQTDGKVISLRAVPLHANLSARKQNEALREPQTVNERVVIVATNVAETSLTIPRVRYVVDTGKEKRRVYGEHMSAFEVCDISKSSANQRAGRAGRVGPGHCYRLYSSAKFRYRFENYQKPEVLSVPLDSVLLSLASMGIPEVLDFPFPVMPRSLALKSAHSRLVKLKLLDIDSYKITGFGQMAQEFPLSPRLATATVAALSDLRVLPYVCLMVSGLSVSTAHLFDEEVARANLKSQNWIDDIDRCVCLLTQFVNLPKGERSNFCKQFGLIPKFVAEAVSLAAQLIILSAKRFLTDQQVEQLCSESLKLPKYGKETLLNQRFDDEAPMIFDRLDYPKKSRLNKVRSCIVRGLLDCISIKMDALIPVSSNDKRWTSSYRKAYRSSNLSPHELVFIHKSSVLHGVRPLPLYVIYNEMVADVRNNRHTKDGALERVVCMRDCIRINEEVFQNLLPESDMVWGEPMSPPGLFYDRSLGKVMAMYKPRCGPFIELELKPVTTNVKIDGPARQRQIAGAFIKALLEGQVFMPLSTLTHHLILKPSIFASNAQTALPASALKLLKLVMTLNPISKESLLAKFNEDKLFMLKELILLYSPKAYATLKECWPFTC